jgi:predicted transcriptional regulator of viral defense system
MVFLRKSLVRVLSMKYNTIVKRNIGRLEAQVLAYTQMRKLRAIRTGELREPLNFNARQERKVLSRLSRAGMIARVWRGVYLVPPRLPLGGKWSPGEFLALDTLMATLGGRFQVCGPNAFNRYGFDEQIPNRLYAYNNRLSGERRVGSATLMLIKVADDRLGDTDTFETPDGLTAVYASRARSLLDAVYDWSRFNGVPRGYEWIRRELKAKRVTAAELVRCTLRYGDTGTIRRMGVLLEREGVGSLLLRKLARALTPTTSPIPWLPRASKRGPVNRRWGVVENDRN